jgi:mono/diheme cytochrome c family protein
MHRKLTVFLVPLLILIATQIGECSAEAAETQAAQAANTGGRSVWDGVYTAAQAARGKAQYEASCGSCHGAELTGGVGQALKGDVFMRGWYGYPLNSLFSRIKDTMPSGAPASLSNDAYLEIVAYMLQVNALPAGGDTFRTDSLEGIRIEGREGPQPIPNYALVRVVGCLTAGPQNAWTLSNASAPVRTRSPEPSKDEELKNSQAKAPGNQQLRLMSIYPAPDPYRGHKVEVKGFLIQAPNAHINVNSLQTLASSCGR